MPPGLPQLRKKANHPLPPLNLVLGLLGSEVGIYAQPKAGVAIGQDE